MDRFNTVINRTFFRKMVLTVFVYISVYGALYFYLGARLSGTILLTGSVLFTPLILLTEKRYPDASRFAFSLSCLIYIFSTHLGIRRPLNVEYYYMAALTVPVLLFDLKQKLWLSITMSFCPLFWVMQLWGPLPEFSDYWMAKDFPVFPFQVINLFGAMLIMVLFLKFFVDKFQAFSKETKNTLHELDEFFNLTLDLFCISDVHGNFRKTNKAFQTLLGYSETELHTQSLISLVHPEDIIATTAALDRIRRGEDIRNLSNRLLTKDGYYKFFSWSATRDEKTGLIYVAGRDISDLLEAEEKAKSEKAKALHNAKLASLGEMSAGIAHEINNPLTTISLSTEMLQKGTHDVKKLEAHSDRVMKAVERIKKIVTGLKKFSHSSEHVDYKEHSLVQIAKESVSLIMPKALKHQTIIEVEAMSDIFVICNEIEMEQVLLNLMSNSIDAIKESSDRWVKIIISEKDDSVILQVVDSGTGIPEEFHSKLFQPFFTTKKIGEGTGLGLSIVKGILEEHNARIELIKNHPNTCFQVTFRKALASIS